MTGELWPGVWVEGIVVQERCLQGVPITMKGRDVYCGEKSALESTQFGDMLIAHI